MNFVKKTMDNHIKKLLLVITLLLFTNASYTQNFIQISLLTSSSCDQEIYTAFGHTAIRVQTEDVDTVYNYGVFDFGDNFVYKFVKGETDYWLDKETMRSAFHAARFKNVYLYEQVLDITNEEAIAIYNALKENQKEENRYYRYNFFYDNCATRPRDLIERNINGIKYQESKETAISYRDIIHKNTNDLKWYQFGIDLCLGSETDHILTDREKTFLPEEYQKSLDNAYKDWGNETRPLVKRTNIIYTPVEVSKKEDGIIDNPLIFSWIIFSLIALITIIEYIRKKENTWLTVLIFLTYGIVGTLLFFLTFFSSHACTNPNFNLLWANPLQLIFAILVLFKRLRTPLVYYQYVNLILVITPLLGWFFIGQKFNAAIIPYILIMLGRTIFYIKQHKV